MQKIQRRRPVLFAGIVTLSVLSNGSPLHAEDSPPQKQSPTVLGDMIDGINEESRQNNRQAAELNRANQEVINASTASDAAVERARQQVNRASLEAESDKAEAATRVNRTDRDESWSSSISDGVTEGVDSGAALIGGAVAGGINAATRQKERD